MANRFFTNAGHFYAPHVMPVKLDCNFVVDSANGNGLGIRSLKGPGIANVYMYTTQTPATGSPSPLAGFIYVHLSDNYNRYFAGTSGIASPVSGTPVKIDNAALTPGQAYIITTVGNSTVATWQSVGLPFGITPAVGVGFIATAAGGSANTSTSRVEAPSVSGIQTIELVGDPNLTIAPSSILPSQQGSILILQCLGATNSSTTTLIPTAPADGSVIGLTFYLSNSSVLVQGE